MNHLTEKQEGSGFGYLITGLAVGAVLGLLFAPKSGTESRQDVADWSRRNKDKARKLFAGDIGDIPTKVKVAAGYGAMKEGGKEALEEAKEQVAEAFK